MSKGLRFLRNCHNVKFKIVKDKASINLHNNHTSAGYLHIGAPQKWDTGIFRE